MHFNPEKEEKELYIRAVSEREAYLKWDVQTMGEETEVGWRDG